MTAVAVGRSLHESAFAAMVRAGGKVLVLDPRARIPGCASDFSAGRGGGTVRDGAVDHLPRACADRRDDRHRPSKADCVASRRPSPPRWA